MGNRYSAMQAGGQWATLSSAAVRNVFLPSSVSVNEQLEHNKAELSSQLHGWFFHPIDSAVTKVRFSWGCAFGLFCEVLFCVGLLAFFERKELFGAVGAVTSAGELLQQINL